MSEFSSMSKTKFLKGAWAITKDYFWYSKNWKYGLGMIVALIALELTFVYVNVQFNQWNLGFYNSLQDLDKVQFAHSIKTWFVLVFFFLVTFLTKFFMNLWLQLQWRVWMTDKYLNRWIENKTFYGIKVIGKESDNPDQRIANDISSFTSSTLTLTIGLLGSVVNLVSFIVILWGLSGTFEIALFGSEITVYGYLVWIVLAYNIIATWLMHKIGKKLAVLNFEQEKREATFRYALMRIREYADSISLYDSSKYELKNLFFKFNPIIDNTILIIKKMMQINFFRNFYNNFALILPIVATAPRLFAKEIKFGEMMQTVSAFREVQDSLSWVIDSYSIIANYRAVTARLTGFIEAMDEWENYKQQEAITFSTGESIAVKNLSVMLPNKTELYTLKQHTFNDNTLIRGASGIGKSTLMRTIAGVWPFGKGDITKPNKNIMYIAQRSYMPQGTLLDAIKYPNLGSEISEEQVIKYLKSFNLDNLLERLNEVEEWTRVLSGGEQQKVAIIRVLLARPDIVFLDEATSAMDNASEKLAYEMLAEKLPNTQIISIGHRDTLRSYHDSVLEIKAA